MPTKRPPWRFKGAEARASKPVAPIAVSSVVKLARTAAVAVISRSVSAGVVIVLVPGVIAMKRPSRVTPSSPLAASFTNWRPVTVG